MRIKNCSAKTSPLNTSEKLRMQLDDGSGHDWRPYWPEVHDPEVLYHFLVTGLHGAEYYRVSPHIITLPLCICIEGLAGDSPNYNTASGATHFSWAELTFTGVHMCYSLVGEQAVVVWHLLAFFLGAKCHKCPQVTCAFQGSDTAGKPTCKPDQAVGYAIVIT